MFPPFPGFEDFPIYVEVGWQGRTRTVVARVEQLPTSPTRATLVCSFLDAPEEGEWLLSNHQKDIYTIGKPANLLQLRTIFRNGGREREEQVVLSSLRVPKIQTMIEGALQRSERPGSDGLQVIRVVEFPDLPHSSSIALIGALKATWFNDWNLKQSLTASFATTGFDFWVQGANAHEWLQAQWNDSNSDVRFAWEWASWSEEERVISSCRLEGEIGEVEQAMQWVLTSSAPSLWNEGWSLEWNIPWESWSIESADDVLLKWQKWLWERFFSEWRYDWIEQYQCVREFWQSRPVAQVHLEELPTMHEQLEARLELRAWLEDKATPEEIEKLIS